MNIVIVMGKEEIAGDKPLSRWKKLCKIFNFFYLKTYCVVESKSEKCVIVKLYSCACFYFSFDLLFYIDDRVECPNPCWLFALLVLVFLFFHFGVVDDIKRKYNIGNISNNVHAPKVMKLQSNESKESESDGKKSDEIIFDLIICVNLSLSVILFILTVKWLINLFFCRRFNGKIKRSLSYGMSTLERSSYV